MSNKVIARAATAAAAALLASQATAQTVASSNNTPEPGYVLANTPDGKILYTCLSATNNDTGVVERFSGKRNKVTGQAMYVGNDTYMGTNTPQSTATLSADETYEGRTIKNEWRLTFTSRLDPSNKEKAQLEAFAATEAKDAVDSCKEARSQVTDYVTRIAAANPAGDKPKKGLLGGSLVSGVENTLNKIPVIGKSSKPVTFVGSNNIEYTIQPQNMTTTMVKATIAKNITGTVPADRIVVDEPKPVAAAPASAGRPAAVRKAAPKGAALKK